MVTTEKEEQQLLDELRELRREKARMETRESEYQRAEQAMHISEERFRTLFEQSSVSMQILSPDGRTLKVNHAFETLWGNNYRYAPRLQYAAGQGGGGAGDTALRSEGFFGGTDGNPDRSI